jgi:hypothetical protein
MGLLLETDAVSAAIFDIRTKLRRIKASLDCLKCLDYIINPHRGQQDILTVPPLIILDTETQTHAHPTVRANKIPRRLMSYSGADVVGRVKAGRKCPAAGFHYTRIGSRWSRLAAARVQTIA